MFIFYDLETSSRELLGQILTYSFIVTDDHLNPLEEFNGQIKLNRTQLPDIDAILTNRIRLSELQEKGDTEYEAAHNIHRFLNQKIQEHGFCTLVGYNSNRFDIEFLRNLHIRYGINPYYRGMLANLDVYHYIQYLAFYHETDFPWVLYEGEDVSYYSFKLEDLTKAMGLLEGKQTHAAEDDVKLTIDLVKACEKKFGLRLSDFRPVQLPVNAQYQGLVETGKQRVRHYAKPGESLHHFDMAYWIKILATKNAKVVLDLNKYEKLKDENKTDQEQAVLSCLRYVNHNKQFFVLEPFDTEDKQRFESLNQLVMQNIFLNTLTLDRYFELINKDWDIEYQTHKMGFERIDTLKKHVDHLMRKPDDYEAILKGLLQTRSDKKDTYMIQLFNRTYLSHHPSPRPDYLKRYLEPRYVTGTLLRNPEDFVSYLENMKRLKELLISPEHLDDQDILKDLLLVYEACLLTPTTQDA